MEMQQRALTAALFALSLAGCGGGGATLQPGGVISGCPAVAGSFDPNAKLVSPANGATGVSTAVGTVTFTVGVAALRSGTLTLYVDQSPGNTGAVQGGPISTDANGVSSSSVPALQPHTIYVAHVVARPVDPATGCTGQVDGNLGSFTTQ
ncbi:MAG TPA: Ig-like domain-containing protein [Candidatus Elarobacter sp.]|jgi:hypothetical protein|nr:Ig-like domain-containing protein [Candidatus Elarobacter sp.]